jgi:hypothetical protein
MSDLPGDGSEKGLIAFIPSRCVMAHPDKHLVYVLGHPEAWRLLAVLEQGSFDRYEQVRKALDLHPQAFQRLLYWMRGYGMVRVRAIRPGRLQRGAVPVHLELAPKGAAMLELLRAVEKDAQHHREALGLRSTELLTVA